MVLTRSRFHLPHVRLPRLQPIRYTSMGLAIAINVAVVFLLSIPGEREFEPLLVEEPPIQVIEITPQKRIEPEPIPEMPVAPVRPVQQQVVPVQLQPEPKQIAETPISDLPTPMSTYTDAAPPTSPTSDVAPVAAPVIQGATVAYDRAPPPNYPRDMLRAGRSGTVVLRILVSVNGDPERVEIEASSGHRSFDNTARDQVLRRWKFHPALSNGEPIRAWVKVPVEFNIRGG